MPFSVDLQIAITECRKICGKQHFLLGQRSGVNDAAYFFLSEVLLFCCLDIYMFFLFQWDQLDSVYQFNWNFSNLEVSLIISRSPILVGFFNFSNLDITYAIIVRMHLKREESCMVRRFIYLVVRSVSSLTKNLILYVTNMYTIILSRSTMLFLPHSKVFSPYLSFCSLFMLITVCAAQLVPFKGENKVICIPVVVAVSHYISIHFFYGADCLLFLYIIPTRKLLK